MNDAERAKELAAILTHWRGGMSNRAAHTADWLFGGDPRYEHLLRELRKILDPMGIW